MADTTTRAEEGGDGVLVGIAVDPTVGFDVGAWVGLAVGSGKTVAIKLALSKLLQ